MPEPASAETDPAPGSPRLGGGDAPGVVGPDRLHPPGFTACPRCRASVPEVDGPGASISSCEACGWTGRVEWFTPREGPGTPAGVGAAAVPGDATCLHHPHRRAEAVCARSGAYLCPLCTLHLHGEDLDVAFVEAGGVPALENEFRRKLQRPDRVALYAAMFSLPLLTCCGPLFGIVAVVFAGVHLRQRARDPLYREVARHGWVLFAGSVWLLVLVGFLAVLVTAAATGFLQGSWR